LVYYARFSCQDAPYTFQPVTDTTVAYPGANSDGCAVIGKIPCIYEIQQTESPSKKPGRCNECLATDVLAQPVKELFDEGHEPRIYAKIDGTCTFVHLVDGVPLLCLRRDLRIPTSGKNEGRYVSKKGRPAKKPDGWFSFADKPDYADHTTHKGKWAHHIGFIPVCDNDKWALDALNEDRTEVRMLDQFSPKFTFKWVSLKDCVGMSFELVGPRIQSDPHGIGTHCLVGHSSIEVAPASLSLESVKEFLRKEPNIEGIVLHFPKAKKCFKVHRFHLGMEWKH